jgi:DNA-binding MarR family transcriptional regulator
MSEVSHERKPGASGGQTAGAGRPSPKDLEIERIVDALSAVWDQHSRQIPDWVAQELTFGQMRLLFLLKGNGPATMSRVAEWLGVGLPAASGIVDRIERHGLVARVHRTDDRRVVECQLTDAGRALLAEIAGMRREVLRETLGVLDANELSEFFRLIGVLLERNMSGRP